MTFTPGDIDAILSAPQRRLRSWLRTARQATYHVASFATVRGGLVTELVEVWAESGVPAPADGR
jgi:hypothetical protein